MTAYEDVVQRMRDAFDMLENIALEQASAEPKRADKVKKALKDVTAALESAETWQRQHEAEERLAVVLEELAAIAKKSDKRLRVTEARLKALESGQRGSNGRTGVKPNRALLKEGRVLAGLLAGPPDASLDPDYYKDAGRATAVPAVDVLADELASRFQAPVQATAGAKS